MTLTPASLTLFLELARDADNWNGSPLIEVSPAERGNLTHLKRAELLETIEDRGSAFAIFLPAGKALAAEHGIDISWA